MHISCTSTVPCPAATPLSTQGWWSCLSTGKARTYVRPVVCMSCQQDARFSPLTAPRSVQRTRLICCWPRRRCRGCTPCASLGSKQLLPLGMEASLHVGNIKDRKMTDISWGDESFFTIFLSSLAISRAPHALRGSKSTLSIPASELNRTSTNTKRSFRLLPGAPHPLVRLFSELCLKMTPSRETPDID